MAKSINSDLIRGNINTIILKALYDRDRYGYDIIREIEEKSHGQYVLKQPTLYSCLKRLETQGFITAYWGEQSNGGRRKYYSLTDMGREVFVQSQDEYEYSRTIIDQLISERDYDLDSVEKPPRDDDYPVDDEEAGPDSSAAPVVTAPEEVKENDNADIEELTTETETEQETETTETTDTPETTGNTEATEVTEAETAEEETQSETITGPEAETESEPETETSPSEEETALVFAAEDNEKEIDDYRTDGDEAAELPEAETIVETIEDFEDEFGKIDDETPADLLFDVKEEPASAESNDEAATETAEEATENPAEEHETVEETTEAPLEEETVRDEPDEFFTDEEELEGISLDEDEDEEEPVEPDEDEDEEDYSFLFEDEEEETEATEPEEPVCPEPPAEEFAEERTDGGTFIMDEQPSEPAQEVETLTETEPKTRADEVAEEEALSPTYTDAAAVTPAEPEETEPAPAPAEPIYYESTVDNDALIEEMLSGGGRTYTDRMEKESEESARPSATPASNVGAYDEGSYIDDPARLEEDYDEYAPAAATVSAEPVDQPVNYENDFISYSATTKSDAQQTHGGRNGNYRSALHELVGEEYEDDVPAASPAPTAPDEPTEDEEPQRTLKEQIRFRNFGKLSQSIRDLGENVKIRTPDSAAAHEFNKQYYYYSNKLRMWHYGLLFIIMLLEGFLSYVLIRQLLPSVTAAYYVPLFVCTVIFCLCFPATATVLYLIEPFKKRRMDFSFKSSMIFRLIIMCQVILIVYALNVYLGMPIGGDYEHYMSMILPCVLATNIPISSIIFNGLYHSKHFGVE